VIGEESLSYQERDWEIVDYQAYDLDDTGLTLRGPRPTHLPPGGYVACVGAAQTYGCFCEWPYPRILEQRLGVPFFNLGVAGAGPSFFVSHARVLPYLERARLVIIQVMSGRSESNSEFDTGGLEQVTRRCDGARLAAERAYAELLNGSTAWWPFPRGRGTIARVQRLARRRRVRAAVRESRQNWVEGYRALFAAIAAPKILYWFSKRTPDYVERYNDVRELFGEFPQLIDRETFRRITPFADHTVLCVSSRGSPQRLVSRFTGMPTTIDPARADGKTSEHRHAYDYYYPSPEMHVDGADALETACRRFLVG